MKDAIIVALIAAVPPTIAALVAIWQIRRDVKKVHDLVNSQYTQLLEKLLAAKIIIAGLNPTVKTEQDVEIAQKVVDDHKSA